VILGVGASDDVGRAERPGLFGRPDQIAQALEARAVRRTQLEVGLYRPRPGETLLQDAVQRRDPVGICSGQVPGLVGVGREVVELGTRGADVLVA
jgi:hypothetical protein